MLHHAWSVALYDCPTGKQWATGNLQMSSISAVIIMNCSVHIRHCVSHEHFCAHYAVRHLLTNSESNSETHNINTRFSSAFQTSAAKLATFQKGPFYFGIKFCNHFPTGIKILLMTWHKAIQICCTKFPSYKFILFGEIFNLEFEEILVQCNNFNSKPLNNLCNVTQYNSVSLLLMWILSF
jgi:hypothetical protein